MAGALEGDLFVGPKAEEHRGLLSIHYPMEHGIVTDWNDMERIWQYIYSNDRSCLSVACCSARSRLHARTIWFLLIIIYLYFHRWRV